MLVSSTLTMLTRKISSLETHPACLDVIPSMRLATAKFERRRDGWNSSRIGMMIWHEVSDVKASV